MAARTDLARSIELAKAELRAVTNALRQLEHMMQYGRMLEKHGRALEDFIKNKHCNTDAYADSVCGGVCRTCRD